MYRDTTDVEHETYDNAGNNWSHWSINKRFKEKFGSHSRKILNSFTIKDSCTWNITHIVKSIAV